MRKYWYLPFVVMAMVGIAAAAGAWQMAIPTATSTFTVTPYANTDKVEIVKLAHTNGTATFTQTLNFYDATLFKVVTIPHASGTTTLTDNWDLYIKDEHGVDVLGGAGENRDQTNAEQAFPLIGSGQWEPVYINGPATFSISGNSVAAVPSETFLYFIKSR